MASWAEATACPAARPAMAGTVLVVGSYVLWAASGPRDLRTEAILSSLELVALHLLFAWLAFHVAGRSQRSTRLRRSWLLLALSGAAGAMAEALWLYFESVLQVEPHYGIADAFFWLQYLSVLAAVFSLPFVPRSAHERSLFALDMGIVLTAGTMALWHWILAPLPLEGPGPPVAYLMSYLVLGLLILAAVTALVQSRVDQVSPGAMSLLAAGMLCSVGANAFSVYAILFKVPYYAPYLNAAWVIAQTLVTLAGAWEAGSSEQEQQAPQRRQGRVVLPYAAVILGMALLTFGLESSPYGLGLRGLLAGAFVLVALVLLRQLLLLRDNFRLYEQAQRAAVTDALTGLYNRLFIDRALRTEVERAQRNQHALSLLLIDVDGFKRINDELGHGQGDRALVCIARTLRSQGRASDIFGRFGGDEFVAILPAAADPGAREVAARMREAIRGVPFEGRSLSVSIGMASLEPGMGAEELLERADREMYGWKSRRATQSPGDEGPLGSLV